MKKFITFEGGEGTGKSTQARLLSKSLSSINEKNLLTREPGGTKISDKIRKILVEGKNRNISSDVELLLIYASRHQHLKEKIIPSLKEKTVICDRYIHSTISYQFDIKNFAKKLDFFHQNFAFNLMPDLTILLDLAPDVGLKRSLKIKNKETRFENKDKIYHEKIRKNFLKLSKKYKNMHKIDASLSKKVVHKKIIDHLNKLLFFKRKLPCVI